jgi:hemerythrin
MTLIEWKASFTVGVPDVDYEHQQLIELINDLHRAISGGPTNAEVTAFLGQILAQIESHFALEERFMRERGYDEFPAHKSEHDDLLEELRDLMEAYDSGETPDLDQLGERLSLWFSTHFRTHDARLHNRLG